MFMKQIALEMAREIMGDPETLRQPSCVSGTSPEALRNEAHIAVLQELTRMGLDLARLVHRQAMAQEMAPDAAAETPAVPERAAPNAALAFSRIAKTIRQCMALEARLGDVHRRRGEEELALVGAVVTESRKVLHDEKRRQVKRAVVETIEAEKAAKSIDRIDAEKLLADLDEKLEDERMLDDLDERSVGECIARLCKKLGVTPDWNSWREAGWAVEEIAEKPAGSPYAGEDWMKPVERRPRPRPTNPFLRPDPDRRW